MCKLVSAQSTRRTNTLDDEAARLTINVERVVRHSYGL